MAGGAGGDTASSRWSRPRPRPATRTLAAADDDDDFADLIEGSADTLLCQDVDVSRWVSNHNDLFLRNIVVSEYQ